MGFFIIQPHRVRFFFYPAPVHRPLWACKPFTWLSHGSVQAGCGLSWGCWVRGGSRLMAITTHESRVMSFSHACPSLFAGQWTYFPELSALVHLPLLFSRPSPLAPTIQPLSAPPPPPPLQVVDGLGGCWPVWLLIWWAWTVLQAVMYATQMSRRGQAGRWGGQARRCRGQAGVCVGPELAGRAGLGVLGGGRMRGGSRVQMRFLMRAWGRDQR